MKQGANSVIFSKKRPSASMGNSLMDINMADLQGNTPLHKAVARNPKHSVEAQILLVRKLLKHGAIIDAANHQGNTPLHIAALQNNLDLVQLLLAAGANSLLKNHEGFTPHGLAEYHEALRTRQCLSPLMRPLAKL